MIKGFWSRFFILLTLVVIVLGTSVYAFTLWLDKP